MTFGTALYTIFLKPLQLIFEFVYNTAYQNIKNPGLAIIALSLAINILVLPLYKRADAMQEEERDTEAKLNKWVTHIKKTFHGDERTMMLQMYYRQNHYSPTYVLRGAISLFLEIPFFIVAYRFLSGLELLEGASFGPIGDLSQPDALLKIGSISVNVLPILMTIVNVISSAIFSKDYPLKTKIQLYAMAAFFLVFLYDSPSGLAFYWTLNNVFSLVKTIFYKLKNSKLVLSILSAFPGTAILFRAIRLFRSGYRRKSVVVVCFGFLLVLPILVYILRKNGKLNYTLPSRAPSVKQFVLSSLFLAVLTGLLIPSAVLKASPQEFMDVQYFVHPLWYLAHSFLLAFGMFVLWFGVFYWLTAPKAKPVFECVMWAFCGIAVVDYLFFGTNLGTMSSDLIFNKELLYSIPMIFINSIVVLVVAGILTFLFIKWNCMVSKVLAVALAAFICMSGVNAAQIRKSVAEVDLGSFTTSDAVPHFTLSKTGKNVVVIMLDRAIGAYVPYLFNEKPELQEEFSGFTYYSNTISFGGNTNFATPALYGGYEYTPIELNKRDTELLKDKHNEALKVMPVLFDSNGYDVTVFDPTYAGYHEIPDLSIYDDFSGINSYITMGLFTNAVTKEGQVEHRNRNFFCYGLTKIAPVFTQRFLYDRGHYNQCATKNSSYGQTAESVSKATGLDYDFLNSYYVLQNLSDMTYLTENDTGSFFLMSNEATHFPIILSEPEYVPMMIIDNTEYDQENLLRFTVDGQALKMETISHYMHYESNMAVMIQLGNWFKSLKEMGVYDNTRIILVSDHGHAEHQIDALIYDNMTDGFSDFERFYPLLMVKDFNSTGFSTSDVFMTNADVPVLAVKDLIENPQNPMTGKTITSAEKNMHDQYIIASPEWEISKNNGTTFLPATRWYSVHDSIWDRDNWTLVAENAVLPFDLEQ